MAAIFGAHERTSLYTTLTHLLQLPGKAGKASEIPLPNCNPIVEGWDVFDCGCRDDGSQRIELQRLDSPPCGTPMFASDEDAWRHVVDRARAGSLPHQRALQMVDAVERLAIEAKCGWCPGL